MKITLTDEQVNSLVEVEVNKRVNDYVNKFEKGLIKVQEQLTNTLTLLNSLLNNVEVKQRKKLTDELFIKLWNEGKKNKDISIETGYNSGYISLMKKRLISEGKIRDRK